MLHITRRPRVDRPLAWLALAVGLCLLVTGGVSLLVDTRAANTRSDLGTVPTGRTASVLARTAAAPLLPGHVPRHTPQRGISPLGVPVRLQFPRLHINAPVVGVAADQSGALAVPDDPQTIGWWDASARPGAASGSVILVGHVDSATRGLGAFFTLSQAVPTDRITVSSSSGSVRTYQVVARRRYVKTDLPASDIFAQTVQPRLILITCGGPFDRLTGSYLDNIVIYALPAPAD